MTRQLTRIGLFATLALAGCDTPDDDPDVARMIELCEEHDDCDAAVDDYLDAQDEARGVAHHHGRAFTIERCATHGCRPEPVDDLAVEPADASGIDGPADDLVFPGVVVDPAPLPRLAAP